MDRFFKTTQIILTMVVVTFLTNLAHADSKEIATLDLLNGGVIIKNQGAWNSTPQKGMTIYHGDKFLTKPDGNARVRYYDDSTLDIRPNSNVRISEGILNKGGIDAHKGENRREVRVLVGKIKYKSGKKTPTKTALIAPKAIVALRGTEVDLSFNGNDTYVEVKGNVLKNGNFLDGPARDVMVEEVSNNPNYQATMMAINAHNVYASAVANKASTTPQKLLILVAKKNVADLKSNAVEAESFINHPDEETRKSAKVGLIATNEIAILARDAVISAKQNAKKIGELSNKSLSSDPIENKKSMAEVSQVIESLIEEQIKVITATMTDGLVAEQLILRFYDDTIALKLEIEQEVRNNLQSDMGNIEITEKFLELSQQFNDPEKKPGEGDPDDPEREPGEGDPDDPERGPDEGDSDDPEREPYEEYPDDPEREPYEGDPDDPEMEPGELPEYDDPNDFPEDDEDSASGS